MPTLFPVKANALSVLPGINHAFFTRAGGVSAGLYWGLNAGLGSNDNQNHVLENRRRMTRHLNVGERDLASPYQVHSPDVVVANEAWSLERPTADGVVTRQSGLAIGVVTADCGPVLLADADSLVIGACHAGWKGALGGVLENTIDAMVDIGARRSAITAILGPTISQQNYEVGPSFPDPFIQQSTSNSHYFSPSDQSGHFMFDLTGYIVDRLSLAGVNSDTVRRCTYEDEDDFYSYRRTTHRLEPDYGRQLSAIVLNPGHPVD
jgi:YfiH family protein